MNTIISWKRSSSYEFCYKHNHAETYRSTDWIIFFKTITSVRNRITIVKFCFPIKSLLPDSQL